MTSSDNTDSILRSALEGHGAREFEIVALTLDPQRGLAALKVAEARGANNPISYAISLFDNPDWQPSGETKRAATNQHVEKECRHCRKDRFVLVTDGLGLYEETYAPCAHCNAQTNTKRWLPDGTMRETAAR